MANVIVAWSTSVEHSVIIQVAALTNITTDGLVGSNSLILGSQGVAIVASVFNEGSFIDFNFILIFRVVKADRSYFIY